MTKAEEYKAEWEGMGATEENFAEVAAKYSADSNAAQGGIYENVFKGQMVAEFEDWCFDDHKVGDTGIVETDFGYHIMFYSGDSKTTYRDYLISNELANADYDDWYNGLVEATTATKENTKFIRTDLVLGS